MKPVNPLVDWQEDEETLYQRKEQEGVSQFRRACF